MSSVAVRPGKSCLTRSSDKTCDLKRKEETRVSFPESSAIPLHTVVLPIISPFILECVSDFDSIDILWSFEG